MNEHDLTIYKQINLINEWETYLTRSNYYNFVRFVFVQVYFETFCQVMSFRKKIR